MQDLLNHEEHEDHQVKIQIFVLFVVSLLCIQS
jgi:hypothetical protein